MIEDLLRAALADANVFEDTAVLFLVSGAPPEGASEYAYLPPGHWGDLEHRVLYEVGDQLAAFSDFHRFGAYSDPVDAPEAGIAIGLRHEAQHAHQFNQYGPHLFYLESILPKSLVEPQGWVVVLHAQAHGAETSIARVLSVPEAAPFRCRALARRGGARLFLVFARAN